MTNTAELRPLVVRFAAGSVKHFGLHMYSTAVPAIAEMVANAWDADATRVRITFPFGEAITEASTVVVEDDGFGMSYDDCLDKYLIVGRDRRVWEKSDRTPGNRPVMGHKGLGKFAPFGIARIVEVRTVKDGHLTHFRMDYERMVPPDGAPIEEFTKEYYPEVLAASEPVEETNGTKIIMSVLRLKRAVNADVFNRAMARRFGVIGAGFSVAINGDEVPPFGVELDIRIPDAGFNEEELPTGDRIRWWVGFTPVPLAYDELRGVSVVARGKLAQTPFFFHTSRGITGQAGMQYMTGTVEADFLDEGEDLIATDRSSVLWEHPRAEALITWGQGELRGWLGQWLARRATTRLTRLRAERPVLSDILESAEQYPPSERGLLQALIQRLAASVEDDDELLWALGSVEGAFQDRRFMALIQRLDSMGEDALPEIMAIIREYEVLESIRLAQVALARIEIIGTFERTHRASPQASGCSDSAKGVR